MVGQPLGHLLSDVSLEEKNITRVFRGLVLDGEFSECLIELVLLKPSGTLGIKTGNLVNTTGGPPVKIVTTPVVP